MNEDVPVEALVKYLVRERDERQRKLDMLVPYTKSLEDRIASQRDELVSNLMKELRAAISERDALKKENVAYRTDFKESSWYKQLHEQNKRLRSENANLRATTSRLQTELIVMKRQNNG